MRFQDRMFTMRWCLPFTGWVEAFNCSIDLEWFPIYDYLFKNRNKHWLVAWICFILKGISLYFVHFLPNVVRGSCGWHFNPPLLRLFLTKPAAVVLLICESLPKFLTTSESHKWQHLTLFLVCAWCWNSEVLPSLNSLKVVGNIQKYAFVLSPLIWLLPFYHSGALSLGLFERRLRPPNAI